MSFSAFVVLPESGTSDDKSYVCIRESCPSAKSSPAVGPEPGVRLVIPRARCVPWYTVGSISELCVD